jgi:hypothetical protein
MRKPPQRAVRLIATVIPGLRLACNYQRGWLRADLAARVTILEIMMQMPSVTSTS